MPNRYAGFFTSIDWKNMITFKATSDLEKIASDNPAFPIIKELIDMLITAYDSPENPYIPEYYGYIVLIEEADVSSVLDLREANCRLIDLEWEGAMMMGDFYYAIYLANDEFGLAFVIPNAEWLPDELKALLAELLSY